MYKTWNKRTKAKYVKLAKDHRDADRFIQGGWIQSSKDKKDMHRGCFLGCLMQTEEDVLGTAVKQMKLPAWVINVADSIFEGLPKEEAVELPVQLLESIPTNVYTEQIWKDFMYTILMDEEHGQYKYCDDNEECKKAVKQCAELFKMDVINKTAAWSAVMSAESTESVAWSSRSTAESAALAALAAWSTNSAALAALAACLARSTDSARSTAELVVRSAESTDSARSAHYQWIRDTLIRLLTQSQP